MEFNEGFLLVLIAVGISMAFIGIISVLVIVFGAECGCAFISIAGIVITLFAVRELKKNIDND